MVEPSGQMKVLVFANCHGVSYRDAIINSDINNKLEVEHLISYENLDNFNYVSDKFKQCDVLVIQPTESVQDFKVENIKKIIKKDCKVFTIPFFSFHGYWNKLNIKEMKNFSSNALMFFPDISNKKNCDDWLKGIDSDKFILDNFNDSVRELKEIEEKGDVEFLDFFLKHHKKIPLFLDPWHPSRIVQDFISSQLVKWLSGFVKDLKCSKFTIKDDGLYFRHYKPISDQTARLLGLEYDLDSYYKYTRKFYLEAICEYECTENMDKILDFNSKEEILYKYKLKSDALVEIESTKEYLESSDFESVKEYFSGSLGLISNPAVLHVVADYFLTKREFSCAILFYEKKNSISKTPWGYLNLARSQIAIGHIDAALKNYELSLSLSESKDIEVISITMLKSIFNNAFDIDSYQNYLAFAKKMIDKYDLHNCLYIDFGLFNACKRLGLKHTNVRDRLQLRLDVWYKNSDSRFKSITKLSNKTEAALFVDSIGIPIPEIYYCDRSLEGLVVDDIPNSFCIKPSNGADSKGVIVVYNGEDQFTKKRVDKNSTDFKRAVSDFVLNAPHTNKYTKILIEQYMEDMLLPGLIPLDYKVHCYGGEARFFQIINRNPGSKCQSFYDVNWRRIDHMIDDYPSGDSIDKPELFDQLIDFSNTIASKLQQMLRIDFYVTTSGVYFGEITTYPAGGYRFTEFGNAISIQLWELYPDLPNLYEQFT